MNQESRIENEFRQKLECKKKSCVSKYPYREGRKAMRIVQGRSRPWKCTITICSFNMKKRGSDGEIDCNNYLLSNNYLPDCTYLCNS